MVYKTINEIIADIGKSNVTAKHLIQAAFELGASELPPLHCSCIEEEVEEEEVVEEVKATGEEELEIMRNNANVETAS